MQNTIERGGFSRAPQRVIRTGLAVLTTSALIANAMAGVALARFNNETASVPTNAAALTLGEGAAITIATSGAVNWTSFTPKESGTYDFTAQSGDDTYGALYRVVGNSLELLKTDDDGGESSNFRVVCTLEAGTTYYLASSFYDNETGSFSVTVTEHDAYDLSGYSIRTNEVSSSAAGDTDTFFDELNLRVFSYDYDSEENVYLTYREDYEISSFQSYDSEEEEWRDMAGIPSEAGKYRVVVEGIGSYHGSLSDVFYIEDQYDLDYYSIRTDTIAAGTTPSAETLNLRVYSYDYDDESYKYLELGKDYEIAAWYAYDGDDWNKLSAVPTEVGRYRVEVEGIEPYYGTLSRTFRIIDQNDLSTMNIYAYNVALGSAINGKTLNLRFYDYDDEVEAKLVEGTDYEISGYYTYDGSLEMWTSVSGVPTAVGNYRAVLTGKGAYHGTARVSFEIVDPYDLSSYGTTSRHYDYDSAVVTASMYLDSYLEDEEMTKLVAGTDYEIAGWYKYDYDESENDPIDAPSAAGDYYAVVSGIGDFSGTKRIYIYLDESMPAPVSLELQVPTSYLTPPDNSTVPAAGEVYTVGSAKYKVLDATKKTVAFNKLTAKKAKSATVPATVKIADESYKVTQVTAKAFNGTAAKTVKLGKNVAKVAKNAFKGSKATKLTVTSTKKPTKTMYAKGCFAGSKIATVKVPKAQKKAYKKLLTKKYTKTKAKKLAVK